MKKGKLQTKMDYATLLKPPPFTISKVGDPEQLLQDFTEYVKTFRKFVLATGVGGEHTVDHAGRAIKPRPRWSWWGARTCACCTSMWGSWKLPTPLR